MIDPRDPFVQRLFAAMAARDNQNAAMPTGGLLGGQRRTSAPPSDLSLIQAADVSSQPWYGKGLGAVPQGRATSQQLDEMSDAELLAWWQQFNKKKGTP